MPGFQARIKPRIRSAILAYIRAKNLQGLQPVARAGVHPDVVYIDSARGADSVYHDLKTALE